MAFTLNGCGTKYYGTRWLPDGSYITTKWFVIAFAPIIPLGSVRITEASEVSGHALWNTQALMTQKVPLDKWMIMRIYAWYIVAIVGIPALIWLERLTGIIQ
jgi:hypothetical protein